MFVYWSKENKVTTEALSVKNVVSFLGYRRATLNPFYRCVRIVTKSYKYIGMTEAAAKACAAAKQAQYTRRIFHRFTSDGVEFNKWDMICAADVKMSHDESGLCSVSINVNEEQEQYVEAQNNGYYDPYAHGVFDLTFDYDEDPPEGECLRVASIYRENGRLNVAYEEDIQGFDRTSSQFRVEHSTDGGATWTTATPTSSAKNLVVFNAQAWEAGLYRVCWGSVASNSIATPATQYTRTLTLSEPTYDGSWRMSYAQDFANYNAAELIVQSRTPAQSTWQNITAQCAVTSGSVIVLTADETAELYFRISYDGVASAAVHTPYHPESDKGDGSMLLLGAYHSPNDASQLWNFVVEHSHDSVDASLFAIKCSEDGMAWSDGTITPSNQSGSKVFGTLGWSGHQTYYAKIFYDGVQVTDAFLLPYKQETDDGIWHLGLAAEVSYTYMFFGLRDDLVTAYANAGGFPYYLIEVDVSTDGGETWDEVEGSATSGGSSHGGMFLFTNQIQDTDPRLFRIRIDDSVHVTTNLKYPLA